MPGINYVAVVVAALVAWVASFAWYILFGRQLATVSPAFAQGQGRRQPSRMAFVLIEHVVIALIMAYLILRLGVTGWADATWIAFLLWLGFSAMQWISSMIFEKEPLLKAAIHAGDWLVKLVLIAVIVGVWR